jgi:hypothetical protein
MAARKTGPRTAKRTRADGRKPLLVYLQPDIIKQLKKAALDEERTAYEITEEAVREWLSARRVSPKRTRE